MFVLVGYYYLTIATGNQVGVIMLRHETTPRTKLKAVHTHLHTLADRHALLCP